MAHQRPFPHHWQCPAPVTVRLRPLAFPTAPRRRSCTPPAAHRMAHQRPRSRDLSRRHSRMPAAPSKFPLSDAVGVHRPPTEWPIKGRSPVTSPRRRLRTPPAAHRMAHQWPRSRDRSRLRAAAEWPIKGSVSISVAFFRPPAAVRRMAHQRPIKGPLPISRSTGPSKALPISAGIITAFFRSTWPVRNIRRRVNYIADVDAAPLSPASASGSLSRSSSLVMIGRLTMRARTPTLSRSSAARVVASLRAPFLTRAFFTGAFFLADFFVSFPAAGAAAVGGPWRDSDGGGGRRWVRRRVAGGREGQRGGERARDGQRRRWGRRDGQRGGEHARDGQRGGDHTRDGQRGGDHTRSPAVAVLMVTRFLMGHCGRTDGQRAFDGPLRVAGGGRRAAGGGRRAAAGKAGGGQRDGQRGGDHARSPAVMVLMAKGPLMGHSAGGMPPGPPELGLSQPSQFGGEYLQVLRALGAFDTREFFVQKWYSALFCASSGVRTGVAYQILASSATFGRVVGVWQRLCHGVQFSQLRAPSKRKCRELEVNSAMGGTKSRADGGDDRDGAEKFHAQSTLFCLDCKTDAKIGFEIAERIREDAAQIRHVRQLAQDGAPTGCINGGGPGTITCPRTCL
ncbi:hypothetical protein GGX14DRAFT_391514 [Mycena pura]|uniref:Uncharacterized protein n=1 Tax=Mycena pura TaxID=153505 RepID=A0AAD6VKP8_9AGAR|nr:hypothetical protein GGX14DRAFT_391514 [Mycena pura]